MTIAALLDNMLQAWMRQENIPSSASEADDRTACCVVGGGGGLNEPLEEDSS